MLKGGGYDMKNIVTALLTDQTVREPQGIKQINLTEEEAGYPWQ